jgi:hypothetical protein
MAFAYTVEASGKPYWGEPSTSAVRLSIQSQLKRIGRYTGPADGAWGPNTVKGIQRSISAGNYYHGPIDGAVGKNTCIGVCQYAGKGVDNGYVFTNSSGGWNNIVWNAFLARLKKVPKDPTPIS